VSERGQRANFKLDRIYRINRITFLKSGTILFVRLSLVRERIDVRVIRKRAFTNAFDSSPSPSPRSRRRGAPSLIA
jgi:hypothetical protein